MRRWKRELASLHAKAAALLFGSGYIANMAGLAAVLEALPGFVVFSDAKNHAKHDRRHARRHGGQRHIFRHNDLGDLEAGWPPRRPARRS